MIEENKWPFDKIPKDSVLKQVDDSEPRTVYVQCFENFLSPTEHLNNEGFVIF